MLSDFDNNRDSEASEAMSPRFGSYVGLVYIVAILCILSFAVFYDVRPGHAYDRLREGMTPTEVAAILGVPRSETRSATLIVQTWPEPDGHIIEIEFHAGKLATKRRNKAPDR
jgi:hypothetical protein